jgi:hypothetical protein
VRVGLTAGQKRPLIRQSGQHARSRPEILPIV